MELNGRRRGGGVLRRCAVEHGRRRGNDSGKRVVEEGQGVENGVLFLC